MEEVWPVTDDARLFESRKQRFLFDPHVMLECPETRVQLLAACGPVVLFRGLHSRSKKLIFVPVIGGEDSGDGAHRRPFAQNVSRHNRPSSALSP